MVERARVIVRGASRSGVAVGTIQSLLCAEACLLSMNFERSDALAGSSRTIILKMMTICIGPMPLLQG